MQCKAMHSSVLSAYVNERKPPNWGRAGVISICLFLFGEFTICMCPGATPVKADLDDDSKKCASPMDFTFNAGILKIVGP